MPITNDSGYPRLSLSNSMFSALELSTFPTNWGIQSVFCSSQRDAEHYIRMSNFYRY